MVLASRMAMPVVLEEVCLVGFVRCDQFLDPRRYRFRGLPQGFDFGGRRQARFLTWRYNALRTR